MFTFILVSKLLWGYSIQSLMF